MATSRVEYGFDDGLHAVRMAAGLAPDLGRVLVVGMSQINRIVVSKIVERSGLKPVSETPQSAIRVLPLVFPGLIVLDGGPDNHDCDVLAPGIMALRRISSRDIPAVILLSNRTGTVERLSLVGQVDAVVPKPFTTDQLQPVVDRLLDKARG
jgi:CheY-like chemotaxis protein